LLGLFANPERLANTPLARHRAEATANLQWAVPALTGAVVVLSSLAGELQRPSEVRWGLRRRIAR